MGSIVASSSSDLVVQPTSTHLSPSLPLRHLDAFKTQEIIYQLYRLCYRTRVQRPLKKKKKPDLKLIKVFGE